MPRVNFYLLSQPHEQARRLLACRLSEQLQRQGQTVELRAGSRDEAEELDQLLWQFTPESFLPHALCDTAEAAGAGILISWQEGPPLADNLLNLGTAAPANPAAYITIAEFVLNEETAKNHSRQLWNHYRQAGYELQHHTL